VNDAERNVARQLDKLRVEWIYEPTTFILETREDGNCAVGFTPDFYLPKLDLYLEVTEARQANTTRKSRKARLAREIHGITVLVFYRRDVEAFVEARARRAKQILLCAADAARASSF